jgi:hypothetical protein
VGGGTAGTCYVEAAVVLSTLSNAQHIRSNTTSLCACANVNTRLTVNVSLRCELPTQARATSL